MRVEGTVKIDVNEITNSGQFMARLAIPEGDLVIELDRFSEFNPCQDGGVAAFIYEHGDSGYGDTNWPKTSFAIRSAHIWRCGALRHGRSRSGRGTKTSRQPSGTCTSVQPRLKVRFCCWISQNLSF